jgi:hypothetical protein
MKFKCLATSNVYEFTSESDIQTMLKHPQYAVVEEKIEAVKEEKKPVKTKG